MRRKRIDKMTGRELEWECTRLILIVLKEQKSGKFKSRNYDRFIQVTGEMELRRTAVGRAILESLLPEGALKYL